ncbi:TIGR04219 family outer membrane beta-barrel protein [Arsukibacterium sp.]|uniref:TIGR04219 family outer membrane beta-barrel protein n=1 Tax=Arsukibacterium sp. TaxID=1977258 RepID=UPI002FD96E08
MKNTFVIALLAAGISTSAQADTLLGLYLGADGWRTDTSGSFGNNEPLQAFNFEPSTQSSFYLALEHPIPVLPNVRLQYNDLKSSGSTDIQQQFNFAGQNFNVNSRIFNELDLSSTDVVLYYELLDNALLSLDFGLNAKLVEGRAFVREQVPQGRSGEEEVSQWLPMLYASTQVGLPLTGLDLFASGSFIGWSDSRMYDVQAGVAYKVVDSLAVNVRLKLGYRAVNLKLDDLDNLYTNVDFKGVFAGIELHF